MSNDQIVTVSTYSPSTDIMYAKAKLNPSGGKNIAILNSKMRKNTMLSTPLMLTWGMSEYKDDKTNEVSYELSLQFPNSDYPDKDGEVFLEKMREFEAKIKADAVTNCKDWFNKQKMSAEVVDALWTPMLKYPKNKESGEFDYARAPTLRVKVPYWEGDWKIELYDMEQRQLWPSEELDSPTDLIPKLTRVACVIQCGGIWFANGKFGITWRLSEAAVKPKQKLARGICHIALTSEQKKAPTIQVSEEDRPEDEEEVASEPKINVNVEDSDDEQADPDSEYNAPAVESSAAEDAKKKKTRNKKSN